MNARIMRRQPSGGTKLVSTGNAKVFSFDNCQILLSYGVPVAVKLHEPIDCEGASLPAGTYRTARKWSQTTSCHLGRWGVSREEQVPQHVMDAIYNEVSRY